MNYNADEFLDNWAGVKLGQNDRDFALLLEEELVNRNYQEIAHIISALRWYMCNFHTPPTPMPQEKDGDSGQFGVGA